jgi:molybdate transport system ATP-binding protein
VISITIDITLRQDAFTLEVHESASVEVLGLFGPSGSGKTSLLEAIAGLRHPNRGAIKIGDRDLYSSELRIDLPARERRIGYVPQDALLFPHLNVRQNILFGRREPGTGNREPKDLESLVEILELPSLLDRRVQKLSGGEKQRVAIARALMIRPALLLLDEPLAAVDRDHRGRILPYLLRIRKDLHVPLVYVTHDADELSAIADRVLELEAGRVTASGPNRLSMPQMRPPT